MWASWALQFIIIDGIFSLLAWAKWEAFFEHKTEYIIYPVTMNINVNIIFKISWQKLTYIYILSIISDNPTLS